LIADFLKYQGMLKKQFSFRGFRLKSFFRLNMLEKNTIILKEGFKNGISKF